MAGVPVGGGLQDLVSNIKSGVVYLGQLVTLFKQFLAQINGTFTLSAAASTNVADIRILGGAIITLTPTNAAAATLVGSNKSPYIATVSAGVGFTVTCASGSAAGGETFSYTAVNPV